jgi:hypothetical protein
MHQEPLLSFRKYHLTYQAEELLAAPSCSNKLLLRPMVEICLYSAVLDINAA